MYSISKKKKRLKIVTVDLHVKRLTNIFPKELIFLVRGNDDKTRLVLHTFLFTFHQVVETSPPKADIYRPTVDKAGPAAP